MDGTQYKDLALQTPRGRNREREQDLSECETLAARPPQNRTGGASFVRVSELQSHSLPLSVTCNLASMMPAVMSSSLTGLPSILYMRGTFSKVTIPCVTVKYCLTGVRSGSFGGGSGS